MFRVVASLIFALWVGTAFAGQVPAVAPGCQLGDELAFAFNERDHAAAAGIINMDALAQRAAKSYSDDANEQAGFAAALVKAGPRGLFSTLFKALDTGRGTVKCMPGPAPQASRALLRVDMGDSGFDYFELVLEKDASGRQRAVDWFQLSRGELLSVSLGGIVRLMSDPNPGLLQTLFGIKSVDRAVVTQMKAIGDMQRVGKFSEAIAAIDKLPKEVAESRLMLTTRAADASLAHMEADYKKTLAMLASKHGNDPAAAVMLLDHYFFEQNTPKVLEALAAIERRVGVDGLTTLLKANAWLAAGDFAQTVTFAKDSIRLEPDRDAGYHSLAVAHIGLQNYPEAVKVYQTLASDFGYAFERQHFTADERFAGFVKSAAFARWLPK